METKLLETFVAIADAGTLSSASVILGIPQSIVSRRIKELETLCGTRLLYRNGRGVTLTPAGTTLYQSAQPLIAQLAAVISSVRDDVANPSGSVAVAIVPSLMAAAGLQILDEMERRFPNVRIELISAYSRYILEWLLQERVDIGILSRSGLSPQLLSEELGAVPIVLVSSTHSRLLPANLPEQVDFAALAGLPLVVPRKGQGLRRYIEAAAAQAGVALNVAYEITDVELCKELVVADRAVTLLARPTVFKEIAARTLTERRFTSNQMVAPLVLTTARNRPMTSAIKAAVAVIKAESAKVVAAFV
ncbi:MAG: LysR family transcriptional regulator [Burkholderiaceae bacterium]